MREAGSERVGRMLGSGAASVDLVLKEACNAALLSWRRGLISEAQFWRAIDATTLLVKVNVKMFPQAELIRDALSISMERRLTVYDSLYLALAKRLNASLLSLDARQIQAAKAEGLQTV